MAETFGVRMKHIKRIIINTLAFILLLGNSKAYTDEKPEIFAQLGHTNEVHGALFLPDGRHILTGSYDKTLKLWNAQTGREIRTFHGHGYFITKIAISPDGKYAISGSWDKTIKLWNIETGEDVRTLYGHKGSVYNVAFSPDGKYILSGSGDKTLKLWDALTGREIRTFHGHTGTVYCAVFSSDGKHALSGSADNTLRLWEVSTGREIGTYKGHAAAVTCAVFTSSNGYFLSGSSDKTLKLWEISTGKAIKTFVGHTAAIGSLTISPDGKHVISGSFYPDKTIRLWDIATGNEILTFMGHTDNVLSLAFSSDGRYILSGSKDQTARLWDATSGKQVRIFSGDTGWVYSAVFSSDGKYVVSGNYDKTIKTWDVVNGRIEKIFKGHGSFVNATDFSPDGKYILSGSWDKSLKLWDATTGTDVRTLTGHTSHVFCASFSPDGRFILSGGHDNTLKLWDVKTGQELRTFKGHTWAITSVAFSPDGRYALSGSWDQTIKLWDIETGREIRTFPKQPGLVNFVVFSRDGLYALSGGSKDNNLNIWNVGTGSLIRVFSGHTNWLNNAVFSADGRYVLSGSSDNTIKLWDYSTGLALHTLSGHASFVNKVNFSKDGRYATSGSGDGTTRLWELSTGREIVTMVGFKDGEWIVITPEGYYNSSLNGHKHLNIRMGNKVYGIDQFYDVFYRPDIVSARLKGEDINSLITLTIDEAIKNPPPTVEITSIPKDVNESRIKVCYQAKSAGGGIGEVRLFHNGKLVHSDGFYRDIAKTGAAKQLAALTGKKIHEEMRGGIKIAGRGEISPIESKSKGEVFDDCAEIEAIPGENEVSISAFNSQNTVQSYMKTLSFNSKLKSEEPHLHILSIGINRYMDRTVNLRYAVKDAVDIKERALNQSATLYKPQNIQHLLLKDKDATKSNIMGKINELSKVIKPNDSFILFVAGHGMLLENQYYMLTHDYDGTLSDKNMISSNEIVEMSKKIKSLSQLFIFDTCHAGGVDYIVSGLYDARMSVLAKKMGLHIYASASSVQEALDGYKGNGLFTHSLLDGLNNNISADKNSDSKVSLMELGEYSKQKAVDISKSIGHPQTPLIINFGKDNPVYNLR
ncbi:MAG: caspase family protein [Nitrospirota bacterium]